MKYYYNGIKVRTSDNKYTHAVVVGNSVIACCGRYDLAVKRLNQQIKEYERTIKSSQQSIIELKNGTYKKWWDGNKPLSAEETKELLTKDQEQLTRYELRLQKLKIVELEVRA